MIVEMLCGIANKGSQKDLAENLGVSRSLVCRWLKGERRIVADYAIPISRVLGVPVETVLSELSKNK